jgi:hypothetical protein
MQLKAAAAARVVEVRIPRPDHEQDHGYARRDARRSRKILG